ncbi:MAG: NAD-dependent epimerase/dehydratase family protein [Gammaproteobacteria bacterium]|nr:NAD-dependent epimerase/dehydratase family protein [Gammaproteobacteria bacterium]
MQAAPVMSKVFVTGGTGFVGRRLLPRLTAAGHAVHALTRSDDLPPIGTPGEPGSLVPVRGELADPAGYDTALRDADLVVHLAALTGKATAAEHFQVNATGTEQLVDAATRGGVRRLVFVSSIVAGLKHPEHYPYARAKARAEAAVQAAQLPATIIRPTLVIGPASPILAALRSLATLPVMPVFGGGRVKVQPVFVDDVVTALLECVEDPVYDGSVLEIGGPDVLALEGFMQAIGRAARGRSAPTLHLPLRLTTAAAATLEKFINPRLLPLTAGQLSVFTWSTTAAPNPLQTRLEPGFSNVPAMLKRSLEA